MRLSVASIAWIAAMGFAVGGIAFAERQDRPTPAKLDYSFDIRPLLVDRCFVCHGPDERARKADLRLDLAESAYQSAIVPGKPEASELLKRITAGDHKQMPPAKSKLSLNQAEKELLRRWIAEGAQYKPHWAFTPLPAQVSVPASKSTWPRGPLDRFIVAHLEREGLEPSPAASKEDWLRRVTFDLTGLPPTPQEMDAFRADNSPTAYEKIVDRLLASPAYGERMASDWLDVARYADSFGYQADGDTFLWPWRDWVVEAFNQNLPYDQFITWQLAGDLLKAPTRSQRLATAFNRLHRMTNEGGSIAEEYRNEYVSDRVHTMGTAFMGLTMECARCHDHKYDPITMKDYYGMGAFFNSIDEWGTYDNSRFRPTPTLLLPTAAQEKTVADFSKKVADLQGSIAELQKQQHKAFLQWLDAPGHKPALPGLVGHYPLDRVQNGNKLENLADAKNAGVHSTANTLVDGKLGKALRFTGDDAATFSGALKTFERWQPFTISFWLQTPETPKQGIVFHSSAGTDTGFHGLECSFDEGKLFLGLIRFWPGNAIAIRTEQELPAKKWVHVTASYDGSGKAGGLNIYLDGTPAKIEVVRDRLYKNLEAGAKGLIFGERFRSVGLKGGMIDDLQVFDRVLSGVEIAQVHDGHALSNALQRKDAVVLESYYFAAIDAQMAKALAESQKARQQLFAAENAVYEIMTMEEMPQPRPAFILARGSYDAPKDKPVGRLTPAMLPPFPENAPRNRLGLAQWLTEPDHPLTARVAVNRYWQMFFGRGLVATTENLGLQGAVPSHPELLDWLARNFIASKWDVKELCKTIVLSATYRQRSMVSAKLRQRDPDNVLLARGPSRRLSAEMLRDSALASSGLLVRKLGGPPAKPYQPPGLWKGQNAFLPEYVPDKGEGLYRRSLYTFWRRTSPPPNMLAFDMPGREVCVARRHTTTTPLQPLVLLNDPQFVEAARGLGERMLRDGGKTLDDRLTFAFRLAAARQPTAAELKLLREHFERQLTLFQKDAKAAQKLLRVGEHPVPKGLDTAELAAATVTGSLILNLDAVVIVR